METRPFKRSDLPKYRKSADSLHIPVIYKGEKRFISDIHFGDDELCWLEGAKGISTFINDLELLLSSTDYEMQQEIIELDKKITELKPKLNKLHKRRHELHITLIKSKKKDYRRYYNAF